MQSCPTNSAQALSQCLCAPDAAQTLKGCYDCVIAGSSSTDAAQAQDLYNRDSAFGI